MSNLSKILERFTSDIKQLKKLKEAKATAQTAYNDKKRELDKLTESEIKLLGKEKALASIQDLKDKQNNFNLKNNEYADTVLKIQSEFEEIYSTTLHSLVDTVYDARKMMHYLGTVKDSKDSSFKEDNEAIKKYLEIYTSTVKFDGPTIDKLISEAGKLNKIWNSNERKKLMSAFSRHEKEDLKNLKTFVSKKDELEKTLKEINLVESVEKLPTTDEIITNYARFIPQLVDKEKGTELSMNDALNLTFSAFFKESKVEKKVEFKKDFSITIILPLYADPIIVVSFDFKLEFVFKASALASAKTKGTISSITLEATCSVSFGASIALSLRIIQLIQASINAGVKLDTSITAKAELKSQIAYFAGEAGLSAESKLIAKTWISLGICGPVALIIKAATGKEPELRWLMGELILFKLTMSKKAQLKLDPMKNEFKADANFSPFREGFKAEFIGKEEIKKKLNEKYNNKLAVIKQQFLSNKEMAEAHDDKVALLAKFDVLDFDAGDSQNDNFKDKVKSRTNFMMRYDNYFNNFMGKIVETLHPNPEEFQKTSIFVNTYAIELKDHYHTLFIANNPKTKDYFNGKDFKEVKDDIWLQQKPISTLTRVLAENETDLISKLKTALARIETNQEYATKLSSLEIIDLDYASQNSNIKFKEMSKLVDTTKKAAEEYVETLVIGDIGKKSCVFGFSSVEIFPSKRKLKHEAIAELKSKIEGHIKNAKEDIRKVTDPIAKIKSALDNDARTLKAEFDKRKTEEVEQEYHKYLKDQDEQVSEYFDLIASQLDLNALDSIKKGIDKLKEFHEKNAKRNSYLNVFDQKTIMDIYNNGESEFKKLVLAQINEKYQSEVSILAKLKVEIDLYDWFKKDNNQQKLADLMSNIETLNDFIEQHDDIPLEEKHWYGDKKFKDYLEKTPEDLSKELDKIFQTSTT